MQFQLPGGSLGSFNKTATSISLEQSSTLSYQHFRFHFLNKSTQKMSENNPPKTQQDNFQTSKPKQQQLSTKPPSEINNSNSYPGQKGHYPNPPEAYNPDPATLREQWRFAIRQYSKWYSHAWGTAILAGGAFFALGWFIKGGNPLPSKDAPTQPHQTDERS